MAAWKRKTTDIDGLTRRLVEGMLARGYPREFAERCHAQIRGFSEYGFPESHAASFALLVYVSAWLKRRHPAAFAAALLDSQPMGFYGPAQLVDDAKRHGVVVREVDVNRSRWDCTLEPGPPRDPGADAGTARDAGLGGPALRLGMRLVRGLSQVDADAVATAVARHGPFSSVESLHHASGVRASALRRLASADAFSSMGLSRQAALWHVRALRDESMPLFADAVAETASGLESLPAIGPSEEVTRDYASVSLSLKAHPVSFHRERLRAMGAVPAIELSSETRSRHGREVLVAGLVLVRQRPSTAKGIVFFTIEDETGTANLILRPPVFERCLRSALDGVFVLARGRVERKGIVVHVQVDDLTSAGDPFEASLFRSRDFH
jgi:error-prone DNA polymerase